MKARPASSPFRRFLRGLTNTCLLLLLPAQLTLWWVATLDRPMRMPDFVADMLVERLAKEGVRLQARNLWVLPDLTIAADDLSVGIEGLTGEIFTASHLELGLNPTQLLVGQAEPTRLRISGARLWCPASVSVAGERRALTEEIVIDIASEGRWLILRSVQVRAGKLTCNVSGEIPAAMLQFGSRRPQAAPASLVKNIASILGHIENTLAVAERSGGATIGIQCAGDSVGGAELSAHALMGNDWADQKLGLIQVRSLALRGALQLNRDGQILKWSAEGAAEEAAWREFSGHDLRVKIQGAAKLTETRITLSATHIIGAGLPISRAALTATPSSAGGADVDFHLISGGTFADGRCRLTPLGDASLRIDHARLVAAEFAALPAVGKILRAAQIDITGDLLLRDFTMTTDSRHQVLAVSGEASCTGFSGLGLSAAAISPDKALPLTTRFDFQPHRQPYPLHLRDLHLASVTGEADCAVAVGGAFVLHLHGDLAPASLDQVLGEWWVGLWKLLKSREHPYAFIDVESRWGSEQSIVGGRVLLERFDFMGAPFRRVEVSVDANPARTSIGLHHLAGGTTEADGFVDGTATWDWSKPLALAGPVVKASGNLQPWIAARCAGKEFGEALKGLSLPADHRFELEVTPAGKTPTVHAAITCAGDFKAWGVTGKDLKVDTETSEGVMVIKADLGLAGGTAEVRLKGDPLHQTHIELGLKGCDPAAITRLVSELSGAKAAAELPKRAAPATLDLNFKGQLNLDQPLLMSGRGRYTLVDPELKKVRLLGVLSTVLEAIGVDATTYDLTKATGTFGCLKGRAYFPDLLLSGPKSRLSLKGEVDLAGPTLDFVGDFSIPRQGGFNPLDLINLNRTLVGLTKIKVKGPISKPDITALPSLKDIIKSNTDSNLGKIPAEISE
jgi:AsmA-like C-terminal region